MIATGAAPALCAPLVGRTADEVCAEAIALIDQRPDLIEWRIDHLELAADADALGAAAVALRGALASAPQRGAPRPPLLITLRAVREGGAARGLDDLQRVRQLAALLRAGHADLVDLEAAADSAAIEVLRTACREVEVPLLLSAHELHRTPAVDAMVATFGRMAALGADIAKLAVMPRSASDVENLLEATALADRSLAIPLVSMSMGDLGARSRVSGHRFGSRITWGSGLAASAAGQSPLAVLRAAVEASLRPV